MAVELTDTARLRVASLNQREGQPERWLRVGIRGGGCSGYTYDVAFVAEPKENDRRYELDDNVHLCVDRKSYLFLNGTVIDFESGLMKTGFVFNNPGAKRTCSCGESFAV